MSKAVLFWIHGGGEEPLSVLISSAAAYSPFSGFNSGGSESKFFSGQDLAYSEDVVVVTFK
jgi:hypothetical protein